MDFSPESRPSFPPKKGGTPLMDEGFSCQLAKVVDTAHTAGSTQRTREGSNKEIAKHYIQAQKQRKHKQQTRGQNAGSFSRLFSKPKESISINSHASALSSKCQAKFNFAGTLTTCLFPSMGSINPNPSSILTTCRLLSTG